MKRLLQIAHSFPPAPSPGAQRPGYLARYLPEFGWHVTTVTATKDPPPFEADVVRAYAATADAIGALPFRARDALLFPDATAAWIPGAYAAARRVLRSTHVDAVLSTAHPPSVHVVGAWLARSGIPWIADYRDAWAGNPYLKRGTIRRRLELAAERSLLARAGAITTISEPLAEILRRVHGRPVTAIPNGFDQSEWDDIAFRAPASFELVFTGSMHDAKRAPDLLYGAIRDLRNAQERAGTQAQVTFYGPSNERAVGTAASFGIADAVRNGGTLPRSEAMRAQRNAAVLLIFLSMDPATNSEMGSKYLEYAGARRPILAFGPPGSVMRGFLERNRLGWFASNLEEARAGLREAFGYFERGAELPEIQDLPTAKDLARRFARLLDGLYARARLERDAETPIFHPALEYEQTP